MYLLIAVSNYTTILTKNQEFLKNFQRYYTNINNCVAVIGIYLFFISLRREITFPNPNMNSEPIKVADQQITAGIQLNSRIPEFPN